ncbi:hypothetical protein KSU07_00275 [Fusobacterium animalis]
MEQQALYSKGSGTKITSSAGNKLDITVNAGTTKEGHSSLCRRSITNHFKIMLI